MREKRMGYSADSRATVHTPKRVFVRFHFTPNYLVHTRRKGEGGGGERIEKKRASEREGEKEMEYVRVSEREGKEDEDRQTGRERERESDRRRGSKRQRGDGGARCKNTLNATATHYSV